MISRLLLLFVAIAPFLIIEGTAQPLVNPYHFAMPDSVVLDTSLIVGDWGKAGERGRITARDGHFYYPDGERFRIVGTAVRLRGCFPDSATAIRLAQRLRALGINSVKFMQFDYTRWNAASVLEPGTSSTAGGLSESQMARFDWFTHQLREHGIYYAFTFHSLWYPRADDGIRQPDSAGSATRTPIFFDPQIQSIHREIMRMVLEHRNPHTELAYKDDPALLYVIPVEDASIMLQWLYSKDIVRTNPSGIARVGLEHLALMDSLYHEFLKKKGHTIDAQLNNAWRSWAENPEQQVRNGDFEDPFDETAWFLFDNDNLGAKAILQFSETEKVSGEFGGRVRIGAPPSNGSSGGIYLRQSFTQAKNKHMYRFSVWLKTTPEQGQRRIQVYIYNGVFPFESYGLNRTFVITDEWQKFDLDFIARASNESTPTIQIRMGYDDGDVFIDDVTFNEIDIPGLRPGESIESESVKRLTWYDQGISEARARDQATFYLEQMEGLLEGARLYIRETIGSDVMLSPSYRTFSRLERYASRNYDFFAYPDFRSGARSFLEENGGGPIWALAAAKMDDKPFIIDGLSYYFPLAYQPEVTVAMPAYAGLQDWDGINFNYFTAAPRVGNVRVDSLSSWEIFDKPFVLTMLPAVSNMIRRGDVSPSEKVLSIANDQDAIDYPAFHTATAFSLTLSADGRMPLIRRIEMMSETQAEESFLPQLEIPSLVAPVDASALDAENEQIFFDASEDIIRILTPRYMAVAGALEGQIIADQDFIVEQVSEGAHTAVTLSSLTEDPITESTRNLLVIGARGVNEGAVFNQANTRLTVWGQGPLMIEGRTMRVTVRAPSFDSCFVTPLGSDARPMVERRRSIVRSPTGRFSIAIITNEEKSPWYIVEFSRVQTGVEEDGQTAQISVAPNPVVDGSCYVRHSAAAQTIEIIDVTGSVVGRFSATGAGTTIDVRGLASGSYTVLIDGGTRGRVAFVNY